MNDFFEEYTLRDLANEKGIDCRTPIERKRDEYIAYYLTELEHMFKYKGGSSNWKWWRIEDLVRRSGGGMFLPHNGKWEYISGYFNGIPDKLYLPTRFTFCNIGLNWSDSVDVTDGVIVRADHKMLGDLPILNRYCELIATCDISIELATINTRATTLAIAGSTRDAEAIDKFYEQLRNGTLTALVGRNILNGIKTQPYGGATTGLTDLIEMRQYLISALNNHYALNSNYNMKREAINSEEAQLDHDALYPYVEDAWDCRREMVKDLNEKASDVMDEGKLEVDFGGIWYENFLKNTTAIFAMLGGSASTEEAPTEDAPAEESPSEEASAEEAPTEGAPAEESPSEEASAEEAPTEDAPAEESPSEGASEIEQMKDTYTEEVFGDEFIDGDAVVDR